MKKYFVVVVILLLLTSCKKQGEYSDGILKLGLGFVAKSYCSCLFVTEQSEDFCKDHASLEQVSPILTVDRESKTTKASLFFMFEHQARYLGPYEGCQLE